MPVNPFSKPPLSPSDLVHLMISRGLDVLDIGRVERHLKLVGYYRLMGYGKHFFDSRNQKFHTGTTYEDIWQTYIFDRKLRLLTLDAIERIEVAIRTAISNEMSLAYGAHWFMNGAIFNNQRDCDDLCRSLRQELPGKKNEIITHYYNRYDSPDLPPSWMIMECISMGTWLKALRQLKQKEQNRIASVFTIPRRSLVSWASSLSWTRNICAHHGVLWNRTNVRPPKTPLPQMKYPSIVGKEASYFATAVISYGFLKRIVSKSTWATRLASLLAEYPTVHFAAMGFDSGWERDPFWQ